MLLTLIHPPILRLGLGNSLPGYSGGYVSSQLAHRPLFIERKREEKVSRRNREKTSWAQNRQRTGAIVATRAALREAVRNLTEYDGDITSRAERFRNCMHVILQHGVAKLRGFLSLASRELAGSQEHIRQRE